MEFTMTIDGVGQAGTGENFEVFNPATGEIFAVAPEGN
jgi:acyl-CoA reductase-like NAD-dependent aldehyde dehydrogenase